MQTIHTTADATAYLNTQRPNAIREAATDFYDVAGADWDGKVLTLLRNGHWFRHTAALNVSLAKFMQRHPA